MNFYNIILMWLTINKGDNLIMKKLLYIGGSILLSLFIGGTILGSYGIIASNINNDKSIIQNEKQDKIFENEYLYSEAINTISATINLMNLPSGQWKVTVADIRFQNEVIKKEDPLYSSEINDIDIWHKKLNLALYDEIKSITGNLVMVTIEFWDQINNRWDFYKLAPAEIGVSANPLKTTPPINNDNVIGWAIFTGTWIVVTLSTMAIFFTIILVNKKPRNSNFIKINPHLLKPNSPPIKIIPRGKPTHKPGFVK